MGDKRIQSKATGYDKFIRWKLFAIPLGLLLILIFIPTPRTMLDVGVEYSMGPKYTMDYFAKEFFRQAPGELSQWQIQAVRMLEASLQMSSVTHSAFLKRDARWCSENKIPVTKSHLEEVRAIVGQIPPDRFETMMRQAYDLRTQKLAFDNLKEDEKPVAAKAGFHVQVAVGIVLFVVLCFMTEAIPLPTVAFCIGIIAMCTGIVNRKTVAGLYWSDATWFIMGSLMFAVAFVKTGLDKRIALMMFGRLKNANIKWVTLILIFVISPLTMFMSDHALAAMFLPIGIFLYTATCAATGKEDPELAKMIMITICMAANLGGSLIPSGAARNIIMMSYAEDMYGLTLSFARWCIYCVPFLLFLMPVTWFAINWRFKPTITDLGTALSGVKEEIAIEGGKWTRQQKVSLIIFLAMLFCWITEETLIEKLTGIRFGVGVFAVMGAVAYVLAGVVNWRDYQTKVDWGVVWLYAGAIIFGRVLVDTGGAYWIARSILEVTAPLGLGEGLGLFLTGKVIAGLITQLMADGPACAAVGPINLAMAGLAHPGTTMIPFMTMGTAIASSFAYCLVIGTPPNAIVYSSGYLESKDFIRVGLLLWFTNMAGLLVMSTTYWRWMGWTGLTPF